MKQTKKGGPASPPAAQAKSPETSAVGEYDWSQAQGVTGFEGTDSSDLGIPFLVIVQKGSPEVDKTNPQYAQKKIAGAEVGDIVNTLSREVLYKYTGDLPDEPIRVIPAFHQKSYVEWKPRDSGGGLVANHPDERVLSACKRNEKGNDVLPNGNLIVATSYVFATLLGGADPKPVVISFTSTQLKKARGWLNTMMSLKGGSGGARFQLPMFSHIYSIGTVAESNAKGSWIGWKIQLVEMLKDKRLIGDMVDYAKSINTGKVRAALPPVSEDIPLEDGSAGKY